MKNQYIAKARKAAASSCGGVNPPIRRQAWLSPAEITTSGRSENRTGMGVTSRKERPANGCCFLPESRAGRRRKRRHGDSVQLVPDHGARGGDGLGVTHPILRVRNYIVEVHETPGHLSVQ